MKKTTLLYFFFVCITSYLYPSQHIIENRTNSHIGGSLTYDSIKLSDLPKKKPFTVPPKSKITMEAGCVKNVFARSLSGDMKGASASKSISNDECLCCDHTFIIRAPENAKSKKLMIEIKKDKEGMR